jgi:hypothetical protein
MRRLVERRRDEGELAIDRGIPLCEEPELGALTLPGFLREVTVRCASREALVMPQPDRPAERWSYRDLWERVVSRIGPRVVLCHLYNQ